MVKTALVVITDGRGEFLERAIASVDQFVGGDFSQTVCADDSGEPVYWDWLERVLDGARIVHHPNREGLASAIRSAWGLVDLDKIDQILHLEDDCVFTAPIAIEEWAKPLDGNPHLAQIGLQRAPQSSQELRYGSLVGYLSTLSPVSLRDGWIEHDVGFSLQPSIYPAWVAKVGWPEHGGETEFTARLREHDPLVRFGYLGSPGCDPVYVHEGFGRRSAGWRL